MLKIFDIHIFLYTLQALGYGPSQGLLHRWLRVKRVRDEIFLDLTSQEKEASVFTIIGSVYGTVKIKVFFEGSEYFWTYGDSTIVMKKSDDIPPGQDWLMNTKFGENLCSFYTNDIHDCKRIKFNPRFPIWEIVTLERARLGDVAHEGFALSHEAPCGSTFLTMPLDNNTITYLSLNMIFNSLRFQKEDHLIMGDDFLKDLLEEVPEKDQYMYLSLIHI